MANTTLRWALRMCRLVTVVILLAVASHAQDPCANNEHRALILSGGGVKGAFEAGAIYHLVVLRGCDFQDFAGVSVGALNAAMLAQA
ncbi:MAG TPA: patatin-like phospholipase family protein, partial [Terriglobales bacterium]|nr:patatin-like phospholipase family protein [Terriglobales bacterium]